MRGMNFPEHWKTARLGEVTDIFKGGTPKRSVEKYFEGDIPWAIPTDVTALGSALYIDDTNTHISEEALGRSAARLLPVGTVLLTSRATIGETAIPTVPMATNQGFANFICKDMLLNIYLAYYLRYVKKRLIDLAHGSTFKEITKGTLLNVEIPLPPLPEQRAIAHVLQTIQEAKAARQRELELEHERKAALMDHLFSHGTKDEPRKQTEIGEIPESWEVVKLGKVCSVKTSFPSFKKIRELESHNVDDDVVFALKVSDMNTSANQKYITESQWAFYCIREQIKKRRFLKPCSIIFPKRGAAIRTNKKRITTCYSVLDPNLIGVQLPNNINLGYLFGFFECFDLGTLQDNNPIPQLNKKDVEGVVIPLPPYSEQQEIAEILNAFDTKIAALEQETARLGELFHAMLDELMTGKRSAVSLIDVESVQSASSV